MAAEVAVSSRLTRKERAMSDDNTSWAVSLPHDPMEQLADNLWRVEGDLEGMPLRRVMTVARLKSGDLVLHSAIAMDDAGMEGLEALGRVAWIVVPNGWHRMDAPRFKARYPDATIVCPGGARAKVEQVVTVDHTYGELPQPDPDDDTVRFAEFGDKPQAEGCMLVRSEDGVTAVFGDTLFNLEPMDGCFGLVYGRLMGNAGSAKVTSLGKLMLFLSRTGKQTRRWMEQTADAEPLVRLVPGHGRVVREHAAATLRAVAARL